MSKWRFCLDSITVLQPVGPHLRSRTSETMANLNLPSQPRLLILVKARLGEHPTVP